MLDSIINTLTTTTNFLQNIAVLIILIYAIKLLDSNSVNIISKIHNLIKNHNNTTIQEPQQKEPQQTEPQQKEPQKESQQKQNPNVQIDNNKYNTKYVVHKKSSLPVMQQNSIKIENNREESKKKLLALKKMDSKELPMIKFIK